MADKDSTDDLHTDESKADLKKDKDQPKNEA